MKQKEKQEAIELRKQGYSIAELQRKFKVSKSTASLWCRDVPLNSQAKKILEDKWTDGQIRSQATIRRKSDEKKKSAEIYADAVLGSISDDRHTKMLICAMMYRCEGSGRRSFLCFTNSNPQLLASFLNLLRSSFDLDEKKFRAHMHLHPYHSEARQLKFWSKTLTIPKTQFMKSFRKENGGIYKREGYQGCVGVRYYDADIARKLHTVAERYINGRLV